MSSSTKRSLTEASDEKTSAPESNTKKQRTNDINRYKGWTVPSNNYKIECIDVNSITPHQFYEKYVKPRQPIVITGGLPPDLSQLQSWTSIEYLDQKAGNETVMVERRSNTAEGYGKGNEISMTFSKFIQMIQKNDDLHYLTTQDVQANDDGRPEILPSFMKSFDDFPLQPTLTGNLIPQNINLWMGNNNNPSGSSSGLHHDYHDNLYVVLKGKKRFRLFSPSDTQYLYTRGELLHVHPNGRINYVGEETTAYGTDLGADAAAKAATRQKKAEERLQQAEKAVEEGRIGAEQELEEAELELEEAMDALIDVEADDGMDVGNETAEILDGGTRSRLVDKTVKNPNNFSIIPTEILDDVSKFHREYPDLQKATMAYCNVNAGDLLYLPASWFHEVTSYGNGGCHLALNYWFHPPDGQSFNSPYSTDFWSNDFRDRFTGKDTKSD